MSAVVAVLNESLTESIRGFYKLRKAYITLDGILEAEVKYLQAKEGKSLGTHRRSMDSFRSNNSAPSFRGLPGAFGDEPNGENKQTAPSSKLESETKPGDVQASIADGADDEDEFFDADESLDESPDENPHSGLEPNGADQQPDFGRRQSSKDFKDPPPPRALPVKHGILEQDPDSDVFSNPIDVFVHSGANLCFGLLLIMISMIPPAFSKLLFIIGFRGDRDRGLRMLWQASKFHNINGAMAGLILLGYYNAFVGFSDITPDVDPTANAEDEAIDSYPKKRCEALLVDMRTRHPKSQLWLLEEARMQASNRHLSAAISILSINNKSPLKQIEAIKMFETSLDAMYIHNYTLCADSFLACVKLNNWSHALYYYIAGAAHVELYRQHKSSNPTLAAKHAEKATKLLETAPTHAGKKKFMARQLPFDIFVTRKLNKWHARAHDLHVPFIDAIGTSPLEEMIFFWNGYKRMDPSQLQDSLDSLDRGVRTDFAHAADSKDEKAILAVLKAATLRNLKEYHDAREILRTDVIAVRLSSRAASETIGLLPPRITNSVLSRGSNVATSEPNASLFLPLLAVKRRRERTCGRRAGRVGRAKRRRRERGRKRRKRG